MMLRGQTGGWMTRAGKAARVAAVCGLVMLAAHGQEKRGGQAQRPRGQQGQGQVRPRGNNQHLAQWMESHRDQPLDQQQHALAAEPGYNRLQPQEQQRIQNRLTQLNSMPPQERQRTLDRTEQMERLQPAQRQQIRGAMQQLGALPEDRRRAVARTYRQLNGMTPGQRDAYMNSPGYRGSFSEQERNTMTNLLAVSPLLPGQGGAGQGQQGPR